MAAIRLTDDQARYLWLRGQRLAPPQPAGPAAASRVAAAACGLQAQDLFAAMLGVRARSREATFGEVERSRLEARSVVWTWAMRGTLHLVASEDLGWLLSVLGPAFVAAAQSRRQQLGLDDVTYERGVQAVRDRLTAYGPSTREELVRAFVENAGLKAGYRIERHLLYRAALEGIICMGPNRGTKQTYVLLEDWLGRRPGPAAAAATAAGVAEAELAARYLAAYAPATPADLAAWSGLPAPAVRRAWESIAGGLTEVSVAGSPAWLPAERLGELDQMPAESQAGVRLLPAFDTYLLGHRNRDLIIERSHAKRINAGGGMIKPVLLVGGCVAGTWLPNRQGRRLNVVVEPFAELTAEVEAGIAAEIADIERFVKAG